MDARQAGALVMVLGTAAIVVGGLLSAGLLSWFGRLPGDVRFSSGSTRVYVPLTSLLLVSLAFSGALALIRRFLS